MGIISMKALLESGVHFGHRTHKWHPHMKPYIFTERNGIHIIDLQKTVKALEQAYALVRDNVAEGGTVLFVGTKRQAQEMIQNEATRCGMPYVTERWLGGMLTNWRTIRQRINELERLERMREAGEFSRITKKEGLILARKIERLEGILGGVRKMNKLPDALFVVDVQREETAIREANILNIPVVGMVDTNCDPRRVDYVIPSNDDAIRAIKLMVGKIADAVLEGRALRKEDAEEDAAFETARGMMEEPELTDEELLGEATLAKIGSRASVFEEGEDAVQEEDVQEEDVQEEDVQEEDVQEEDVQEEDVQEEDVHEEDVHEEDVQEEDVQEEDVHEEDVQEEEHETEEVFVDEEVEVDGETMDIVAEEE
jgi:small subunit ribosomal protein S2